jgi:hypothetical protein
MKDTMMDINTCVYILRTLKYSYILHARILKLDTRGKEYETTFYTHGLLS